MTRQNRTINLCATLVFCAPYSLAVSSGQREVVLNNADVEVVRLTYPAGTESGIHTHTYDNRVVYFIKGGTLILIPEDSRKPSTKLLATDGQTLFLPATTHNVRNIGQTEVVILETELK
jgi:mannose-6-phosphate isomerase-like protein (cupin superfamily)